SAITDRTRVIVPVHYAGVACEMDTIMEIARRHNLLVVEDAAQGVMSTYKGKALGSIGDIGCFSFHATKNYSMGEGGACLLQDPRMNEEAEILREKGTNRSKFFRGQVDKYTWVGFGSSYLPSDLNAAYLLGQLESAQQINENRLAAWSTYFEALEPLASQGLIELPAVPQDCVHNAHLFFVKCRDLAQRTQLIKFLATQGIAAAFHYVPLHSSPAGRQYGQFVGEDCYTTSHSDRLVRLPLYYDLASDDQSAVIEAVCAFFEADMN
ncbi:MAG: dTDP-4-amino-4,6-dideoxygalactose transaminase, partial [Raoultibacter sp.]